MAKIIGTITCPCCGASNDISQEDLGFEEFECRKCDIPFTVPESVDELDEVNKQHKQDLREFDKATHVRIMARGEDGHEWCIKNMIAVDNELLDVALTGYNQTYPEATIWTEDEEVTSARFTRNL